MTDLQELANQLRVDSIRCTTEAGSGHPTSAMSAADLMAVLMAKYFRYDWKDPHRIQNDRLIFSKGHACPLLYAMFKAAGAISNEELLSLRKLGSRLQGHPNPRVLPYLDVATGSLGQGLPMGVGMALNGKYLDKVAYRVWVVLGDSEMAEGSIWEAFDKASYYKLDNLVAILDMNRLGQCGETALGWNSAAYAARARAFGWHPIEINGHDFGAIDAAFAEAMKQNGSPTCIVAKTEKGHGFPPIANKNGWHGKALPADMAKAAVAELGGVRDLVVRGPKPAEAEPVSRREKKPLRLPRYEVGKKEATRKAYGDVLVALGDSYPDIVALDGEVSNSTHSGEFKKAHPERFFEMFISEQQMVSCATGMAALGKRPFASTFAAFLTRAYDQTRMAAISGVTITLVGSHAGVSIGADGPSQMGLEDLSMMRAVHGSTVLYPCDANQTAQVLANLIDCKGITYLRTTREKTPVIYSAEESFPIGGAKVIRGSGEDRVAVIAAGITVHEALKAADTLKRQGTTIRIIDAYSIKPIDQATLVQAAKATEGKIIVVEDHWLEGGLGDAVLESYADAGIAPRVIRLAVRDMPGSGTPAELLHVAGIDAESIAEAVRTIIRQPGTSGVRRVLAG